jgi:UDP-N-acetylmuramyl tripeptide synthase
MNEIALSFEGSTVSYLKIADRRQAILEAVRITRPDDLLILAGKGHEQYQLIGTQKLPFSDKEVLLHALQHQGIT